MNWITALLCFALCSCTVAMRPKKKSRPKHKASSVHSVGASRATTLVDEQWITRYKALESKSNYAIPQDSEIKAEGTKFRVPQEVVTHNDDMLMAPLNEL